MCNSRPALRFFADTHPGKKLKKRLKEAEGIIASGSRSDDDVQPAKPSTLPDPPFPKDCIETDTADLRRGRGSRLQDSSVVPGQQQCKGGPSDALLPATPSLLSTSGEIAGGTAQSTDPCLPRFNPSTSVAAGLATPFAIEHLPPNLRYVNGGGSPFDEGYLAMNGPWVAAHHW